MKAVVFVGPTLAGRDIDTGPNIALKPPAAQGDVYDAARRGARAIGLIDGRFETVASVWHKEILWALSRGIPVYGAASMGALRAAELAPLGMIGVGRVFEDYRSGRLERDDEVAVLHAPADHAFRPLSEALVDMRATLEAAAAGAAISARTASTLEGIAANTFYKERTWKHVVALGRRQNLPARQLDKLMRWLGSNRVERKRSDALAMIAAMRRMLARRAAPSRAGFAFRHTQFWQNAVDGR